MLQEYLAEMIKLYFLKVEELKIAKSILKKYRSSDLDDFADTFYKKLDTASPIVLTWEEAEKLRKYSEEKERLGNRIEEIEGNINKIIKNIIDSLPLHNVFIEVVVDAKKYFVRYYPESNLFGDKQNELVITTELA